MLNRWISTVGYSNLDKMKRVRDEVATALAGDEVITLALGNWQRAVVEQVQNGENSDEKDMKFLADTVELLFDMLPSIRGLRREVVLKFEAKSSKSTVISLELPPAAAESYSSMDDLTSANSDLPRNIEDMTQAADEPATARSSKLSSALKIGNSTPSTTQKSLVGRVQRGLAKCKISLPRS